MEARSRLARGPHRRGHGGHLRLHAAEPRPVGRRAALALSAHGARRHRRGLFGLTVGAILLLVHLAGLTSLGVAYLAPFSDVRGWRAVLRPRLSRQKFRDPALGAVDRKNQK